MRAAVLTSPGEIVIEERPVPEPGPAEVLVRVTAVGICGSDVHYFEHGKIGRFVVDQPLVLGHEAGGVVERVGADVTTLQPGQRVSLEPGVPDLVCAECLAGRYNLCPQVQFFATPPFDGAFVEYLTLHHAFAHPIPDSVSDQAAAMLEPLSVGLWACAKADIGPSSTVLVTGAGPVGLLALQSALAHGATDVVVADINDHRLKMARQLGASRTINSTRDTLADTAPTVFLECSGAPAPMLDGINALRRAGTAVLVGLGAELVPLPVNVIQEHELTVTGTFRYANTWPTAVALAASGRVSLEPLITGTFPLAQTADALHAGRTDPQSVKVVVLPQQ